MFLGVGHSITRCCDRLWHKRVGSQTCNPLPPAPLPLVHLQPSSHLCNVKPFQITHLEVQPREAAVGPGAGQRHVQRVAPRLGLKAGVADARPEAGSRPGRRGGEDYGGWARW